MLAINLSKYREELISNLQKLMQIKSTYKPSSNPQKPFGEGTAKALEFMLDLGNKLGFRTKNIDGYCGYIEFGEGEELLGIIGHLDVVPEGENWTYPPYSATIANDKIYGRGAIDDKGPVMASLYSMKIIQEHCLKNSILLKKRIRLILGLNEENDWECINYYKKHEEIPTISFSPDADFPCIYAEKGILSPHFSIDYTPYQNESIIIKEIDCNHNALNVVPKICSTVLKIDSSFISMEDFISTIKSKLEDEKHKIDIYQISLEEIKLTSHGIQAHAAHPELGVNAISPLILLLNKIFTHYQISIPLLSFFDNYVKTNYHGEHLGIDITDESGRLTANVGTFELTNNQIVFGMNLRIPVTTPIQEIEKTLTSICNNTTIHYESKGIKEPLYISKQDSLVTTLCNLYNQETNSKLEPIAIGGATYARAFPNCISFGPNLPGQKDMCHQTNEFISIDNLLLATKLYAKAILKLAE